MEVTHIFFDLDHTLWDFEKNSALTFQKILPEADVDLVHEQFINTYIPINAKYWKLYREEKVSKAALRYARLKETFHALKYEISDKKINSLAKEYILQLPNFNHLFDGTLELLDYLKEKYTLHIITNGFEEVQTLKMKKSKIFHYFTEVITSESVGVKKPNPKVFLHAMKKAGSSPKESLMIGDNIEADIQGALATGMKAIHCNFENTGIIPNNITSIRHLLQIKQYI